MNIRDLKPNASPADQLRNSGVGKAQRADTQQAAQKAAENKPVQQRGDTVEISAAARQAAAENQSVQDVNFAKKALLGVPPLSEDRAADILKRIQSGYYNQPEVIDAVAKGLTKDLTGRE